MNKILAVSIASLFLSTVANAASFDGPYVQIGVGMVNNATKASIADNNVTSSLSADLSKDGAIGQILGGYSHGFDNKFNLAANIFYNFGEDKSGGLSLLGNTATLDAKLKNVWGISFEPGYYFSENTLGYIKLGYQRGDVQLNGALPLNGDSASTQSKGVGAFLYGFGIKQLLTSNLYIGAEVSRADYSNESLSGTYYNNPQGTFPIPSTVSIKSEATQTLGLVTLGYKF